MKQLIGINDTIQKMKKRPTHKVKTNYHPTPPVVWKMYQENESPMYAINAIEISGSQSNNEGKIKIDCQTVK